MAYPIPEEFGAPPAEWDHKLISDKAEIERLSLQWTGAGIITSGDLL